MTLKAAELDAVAREVAAALVGRPVQKVTQPDRVTVILWFPKRWLLLSADARLGRMHLTAKPAGTGEAAPAFCMLLRKELVGARLVSVAAVAGERACELRFARAGAERSLRLFLFGRSAQLQLVGHAAIGPATKPHESLPPPRDFPSENRFGEDPSARIDAEYGESARATAAESARVDAERVARAQLEKLRRKLEALRADRARAAAAVEKRKLGDLLLAHLAEVPRGASEVTLPDDFSDGAPIRIALDPAKSARDNAARFYKEHKRLSRALGAIDARIDDTRREIARIEREGARSPRPRPSRGKKRDEKAPAYREYRAADGTRILVGRGADRNDELTFQIARGGDLWLHARDVPGAHVIVLLQPGHAVSEPALLDAATLAAHHSNARGEAQVDVGYTLRKHVRKPPRSRPGLVTTSEMKTLRVRLEPERLARLLASVARDRDDGE